MLFGEGLQKKKAEMLLEEASIEQRQEHISILNREWVAAVNLYETAKMDAPELHTIEKKINRSIEKEEQAISLIQKYAITEEREREEL